MDTWDQNPQPEKQTIVVVHGTQLKPPSAGEDGKTPWWAPGSDFAKAIDTALEAQGSPARCWKHLRPQEEGFAWDGRNNWYSRAVTADRLRDYVRGLKRSGWLVHVVAHSHGGNVVMDALTTREGKSVDWFDGQICLLGTPVLNRSDSYSEVRENFFRFVLGLTAVILVLLAVYFGVVKTQFGLELVRHDVFGFFAIAVVAVLFLRILMRFQKRDGLSGYRFATFGTPLKKAVHRTPQFLLIGSLRDEAYKFLGAARTFQIPKQRADTTAKSTAVNEPSAARAAASVARTAWRSSTNRYLNRYALSDIKDMLFMAVLVGCGAALALAWHGSGTGAEPMGSLEATLWVLLLLVLFGYMLLRVQAFLKVCAFPILLAFCVLTFLGGLISGLTIQVLYDRIVQTVEKIGRHLAFGLLGGPVAVRQVEVGLWPSWAAENWIYLELPEASVKKVRKAQTPKLTGLAEELYLPHPVESGLTMFDTIAEQLSLPLIHYAYYAVDGDCPQVIADWVGMGRAEELPEMISYPTTHLVQKDAGYNEDAVFYPHKESWSTALLRVYRPDDGWVCVLPSRICSTVERSYINCKDSNNTRRAKMFKLSRTLSHPSQHGRSEAAKDGAPEGESGTATKPIRFQVPPQRSGW